MKTIPFSLFLGMCLWWAGPGLAQTSEPPPPDWNNVSASLPYAELKRLLQDEAARRALSEVGRGKPPPVAGGLMASLFRLDGTGGKQAVQAEFRVENFSGEWETMQDTHLVS